ncbi:hypothetical protein EYF80_028781 [Liparis tanakae]|uniref:Uncharacterized protein n=1 Tax=Liparis tanakae TaxID=230148 RepID=A0A4Z2H7M1_9TELE|nr:hypothetical protein EYF80_028781 [Liparis tanakae]
MEGGKKSGRLKVEEGLVSALHHPVAICSDPDVILTKRTPLRPPRADSLQPTGSHGELYNRSPRRHINNRPAMDERTAGICGSMSSGPDTRYQRPL